MNRSPMNNPKDDNLNNSNNSNKVAVALSYEAGEQAPRIIASGRGYLADQIIEKSKESDVPVYQDNKLASTLTKLEIGDMIPPELYGVVAEILVFVDDMDRLRAKVKKK